MLRRYNIKCKKCGLMQSVLDPMKDEMKCFHCGEITCLILPNPFRPMIDILLKFIRRNEQDLKKLSPTARHKYYCHFCHRCSDNLSHDEECEVGKARKVLNEMDIIDIGVLV